MKQSGQNGDHADAHFTKRYFLALETALQGLQSVTSRPSKRYFIFVVTVLRCVKVVTFVYKEWWFVEKSLAFREK